MASLTVFRKGFLTLESAALGRLVPNAKYPGQDFWPMSVPKLQDGIVQVSTFEGVHNLFGTGKQKGVWAKVSRFFSVELSNEVASSEDLDTAVLRYYTLTHPTLRFRTMCEDKKTQEWIEVTQEPIFLTIGLIIVQAAAIEHSDHEQRKAAAKAEVSASDILTAGGSVILPADALSIGMGGLVGSSKKEKLSFIAPDERVIGIQYRKLKFKWFSKHEVDKAYLEKNPNRWVLLLGGSRGGTEDILDADLQDSITADDLQLDDDDGKIDIDGEFVFTEDAEESWLPPARNPDQTA